jgi:hypothetical protein
MFVEQTYNNCKYNSLFFVEFLSASPELLLLLLLLLATATATATTTTTTTKMKSQNIYK